LPPSKDENRPQRTTSLREKSGRKPGGQPGHEGRTLEMSQFPDKVVEHRAIYCSGCGKGLDNFLYEQTGRRQVIDIPVIRQIVTEHRVFRCKCTCGYVNEGLYPKGVDCPVRYGENIEALLGYLNVRQYIPFKRLRELMNDIFGVSISEGGLHVLLNRLVCKGTDAYQMIMKKVMHGHTIGADETGMKVNGKKHWFWTWQTPHATYIAASKNRGTATIKEKAGAILKDAILVHDCWKAHFQTPVAKHQLCTAHLQRETKFLEQNYKSEWPKMFRDLLLKGEKLKKQFDHRDYFNPNQERNDLEKELVCLLNEQLEPKHKQLVSFQKRLSKYRDHIFTFLHYPDVPPDNNGSERAIRNVKVKQKISGQFKVFSASENFAILRSIIDTAIKNKQNAFNALAVIANY
jgi:transposase